MGEKKNCESGLKPPFYEIDYVLFSYNRNDFYILSLYSDYVRQI